jgi:hypothetical protein
MPHFKPAPNALRDLDYTPRFYCQCCGAGVPAQSLSERTADGGVVREISCPVCRCQERVGIQLAEDFSGDDKVGAFVYLALQIPKISCQIRSFEVLFRIAGNADAKISRHGILNRIKIDAMVHIDNLFYQVRGVRVGKSVRFDGLAISRSVSAQRQHVGDAVKVQG